MSLVIHPGLRVREALDAAAPVHRRLKKAWTPWIRRLRASARALGEKPAVAGRGELEALLDAPLQDGAEQLCSQVKSGILAAVASGSSGMVLTEEEVLKGAQALLSLAVPVVKRKVEVQVEGWPLGFGPEHQRRLLEGPFAQSCFVEPTVAAALLHRWDGFVLGGARLRVRVQLPAGLRLPAVPRGQRASRLRRGRTGPWLPITDAEARRGLTPRALAERQAVRIGPATVIEAFSGCGGNAVAFGLAGSRVYGVEIDPERCRQAQVNVAKFGLSDRIELECARAEDLVPILAARHPQAILFLDPPWGGEEREELSSWGDLFGEETEFSVWLASWPGSICLKLPRSFDLSTLPARNWEVHFEFGAGEDDRAVVRMITALSLRQAVS